MISNIRVFGSVARGEDKEGSDLDLYVDAAPGTTLFDLGGFREDIVELLGVSVDIITSGPYVRKSMMESLNADARPLFSDKTTEKFFPPSIERPTPKFPSLPQARPPFSY